jgi:tetratricopeptide (TPR) repeat protein
MLGNVAGSLYDQGKFSEAEAAYREALAIKRNHPEAIHDTNRELWQLAKVLQAEGKLTEAEADLRQALATQRKSSDTEHPRSAAMLVPESVMFWLFILSKVGRRSVW